MDSPPPTPNTRSNKHASRTTNLITRKDLPQTNSVTGRKRTREQAGLITPRETPVKEKVGGNGRLNISQTAKVLFPTTESCKIQVYQDPRSPDPFTDDKTNPFSVASPKSKRLATIQESPQQGSPVVAELQQECTKAPDRSRSGRASRSAAKKSPSPRRTDGMTYVFRGRKVFKKFESAEQAQLAESIAPKRLFQKEMSAPKLDNPFDEGERTPPAAQEVAAPACQHDGDSDELKLSTSQSTGKIRNSRPKAISRRHS